MPTESRRLPLLVAALLIVSAPVPLAAGTADASLSVGVTVSRACAVDTAAHAITVTCSGSNALTVVAGRASTPATLVVDSQTPARTTPGAASRQVVTINF